MARTKQQIKDIMTTNFMGNATLAERYGFVVGSSFAAEFSLVSLENFLFDIIAWCHYLHEQIFDQHSKEVDDKLLNQKTARLSWWKYISLNFQYGVPLVADHDYFDNTGLSASQVENSKIVKYCAVDEVEQQSGVILKIAGEVNGVLAPITAPQLESYKSYIKVVKPAGIPVTVLNFLPDRLYFKIQIKRDANILTDNGLSILNANYPVNEAIAAYMKELPFNGELRLSTLIDRIQVIPGVIDATVISAESSWIQENLNGYGQPQSIYISKVAESGYFEVVTYDNIEYVV